MLKKGYLNHFITLIDTSFTLFQLFLAAFFMLFHKNIKIAYQYATFND